MLEQYKVRREERKALEREALERKVEKEKRKQLKLAEEAENIRLQRKQEAAEKARRCSVKARSAARNVDGRGGHGRKGKNRGGRNGGRDGNRNDAAITKAKDTRRNKAKKTKKVRFVGDTATKKKIGTQSGSLRTKKVTAVLPDSAARTRKEEREWMDKFCGAANS